MKRVTAVTLQADSPLGHHCIGDDHSLADYDLVVITGPNGAGKTTIVEALCDVPKGVTVADCQGNPAELTKKEITPSLLVRSGRELMDPFKSMKDALARASGIRRIREEGVLLDALLTTRGNAKYGLDRHKPSGETQRPQAVDGAIRDYRAAEQAVAPGELPSHPLTLATYNRFGHETARHLNREWIDIASVDEAAMRESESSVQPEHTVEHGGPTLDGAIAKALSGLTIDVDTLQGRVLDHEASLKNGVTEAQTLAPLAGDEQEPNASGWAERCRRLARDRIRAANEKTERRKTIDRLNALRRDALTWLEAQEDTQDCPVCDQSIETEKLKHRLAAAPDDGDNEVTRLTSEAEDLTESARKLKDAADEIDRCLEEVKRQLQLVQTRIEGWQEIASDFLGASTPAVDWAEGVRATAVSLRNSANGLDSDLKGLDATLSASKRLQRAGEAATGFHGALSQCHKARVQAADEAQAALGPATRSFKQLAPLRDLLLARKRLNETVWGPTWEQDRVNESKRSIVNTWIKAARELREEKTDAEGEVQNRVLADPGVEERFNRLLEAAPHPFFRDATFVGNGINKNAEQVHDKLSEGFLVITNLAAFMAVTGYVCDGAEHQAGWIVLDEPTNGLDPTNRCAVARYLGGLTANEMPRQMFVTTFEDGFRTELINAAVASRRRVLEISLEAWSGNSAATAPTLTPHEQKL